MTVGIVNSHVYHADKSHNLSIQSLYTFCTDFNYSHTLDQRANYKFCGISRKGSHIFDKYHKSDQI